MSLPIPLIASDRRRFLKHFALSTAVSIFGGKVTTSRLLADVDPYGFPVARIRVKLSDFPGLETQFGSVRFAFADPSGGSYPFVLSNAGENVFYAVDTRCTHQHCVVEPFDGFALNCYCHGSVGSSRVDLQACKLEYSIVSPK